MKFLRVGNKGEERPAIIGHDGHIRDLSSLVDDISPAIISSGRLQSLSETDINNLVIVSNELRIGSCISTVPNFYCIGLNYYKPGAPKKLEGSNKVVITSKSSSSLSGPYDDLILPKYSLKTDWEVELGIIIGKEAFQIKLEDVKEYIFGYTIVNDLSERDFMFEHGGQWIKGKSYPGFGPIGPWIVTPDEIHDPQKLTLSLSVNNQIKQDSNTSDMITPVLELVYHLSNYIKLLPGDIISTGTPSGIGMHRNPPEFLKAGDQMILTIENLGQQIINVKQES